MAIAPRDTSGFGRSDLHIPSVINPPGRRCITLSIPDDPEHVRLLAGVLHPLTKPYNWTGGTEEEKDEISSAYAQMYLDIDWLGECMPPPITGIQISGCNIEVQFGNDLTWVIVGDVNACLLASTDSVRQDITPPGNMQLSHNNGGSWADITNTDFVWRDGQHPMTGGLEIVPATDVEPGLSIRMPNNLTATMWQAWRRASDGAIFAYMSEGAMIFNNHRWDTVWSGTANPTQSSQMGFEGNVAFRIVTRVATAKGLIIRPLNTSQSAALLSVENFAGTRVLAQITSKGAGIFNNDDDTSGVLNSLTLGHNRVSAAGDAGLGTAMRFQAEDSTTESVDMARLYAAWETNTHATRAAKVVLSAFDFSGEKTILEGGVTGASTPKIGVLGATPQPRLALTGDCQGNTVVKSIAELLALFGFATDATMLGTSVLDNLPFVVVDERQKNPALLSLLELGEDAGLWVNSTTEGECCEDFPIFWCKVYDFTVEADRLGWSLQQGFEGTGGFWNDEAVSQTMFVQREEDANFKIYDLTIDYEYTGSGDFNLYIGGFDFTDPAIASIIGTPAGTGTLTIDLSPGIVFPGGFRIVAIANDTGETIFIHGMTITGFDQGVYDTMGDGNECPPEP